MGHSLVNFLAEKEMILDFLDSRSQTIIEYIKNSDSHFSLWYKNLSHSDLTNRGKRNGSNEGLEKNLLYYLSVQEMKDIESANKKPFESAKQSNIGMSDAFYKDLGIPRLQRRKGPQSTQHNHIILNDFVDVFLVNDTISYFKMEYTKKVLQKLCKTADWDMSNTINLSNEEFTPIQLTQAIHGLGTANDTEFHKLRLSMFCNDTFIVLIEHAFPRKKMYIMLDKNPRFYTLIGETNAAWENYLKTKRKQETARITASESISIEDEKSRNKQSKWKLLLANEMMNYTTHEGEVFCPFTQISAKFESVPMLFIASHIKRFIDSDCEESFDVNNGLLLCANADALFDKHMITVSEDKKLIFSFLIDNDFVLKQKLLLNQPIFEIVLNEKRMEYMKDHREMFFKKEQDRKKASI